MSEAPPITVGLPVSNGERYLADALESILAQTFADFTVVVSDNASTDGSEEIVRSYAERDSRVQYFREADNRGAAWNFNRVFAECRSPFFKWAASDDRVAPTFFERCYEMMRGAPADAVVLVAPRTRFIDSSSDVLEDGEDHLELTETTPHARLRHLVGDIGWSNTIYGLHATSALRRTRGLGSYASADWVLLAELALLGQFWVVPEFLFFRRSHEGMSRRANVDPLEVARWFDPTITKPENELRRVAVEYLRGIEHVPLSRVEKVRCHATAVVTFAQRYAAVRRRLALRTRLRALRRRL